jgi:hypothetical protein
VAGECFFRPAEFGVTGDSPAAAVASAGRYDGCILHRNSVINCPSGFHAADVWAELLKIPGLRVINLKRHDYFAMLCSLVASQKSGVWQIAQHDSQVLRGYEPGAHEPGPLRIDPARAEQEFRQFDAEYAELDRLLKARRLPVLDVSYEQLQGNWNATLQRVQEFLALPIESLQPATAKQNTGFVVENYAELAQHFATTKWAKFVSGAPLPTPKASAARWSLSEVNRVINGLWIGPRLSLLEQLTIKSFLHHGHEFRLWTYDPVENVPEGAMICDASEILPRSEMFSYEPGTLIEKSVAGFSDVWRFAFLYQRGGWYVDMDLTCLRPFDFPQQILIRKQNHVGTPVANWIKLPAGHPFALATWQQTARLVNKDNVDFILPMSVLGVQLAEHGLQGHLAAPETVVNLTVSQRVQKEPIRFANERERRAEFGREPKYRAWLTRDKAYAIHWNNQHHHWHNINLDKPIRGTLYESLLAKHGLLNEHVKA